MINTDDDEAKTPDLSESQPQSLVTTMRATKAKFEHLQHQNQWCAMHGVHDEVYLIRAHFGAG